MKCFLSSLNVALVWMEAASLPLAGSVRQKAAMCSPDDSLGRYLAFCSSLPTKIIPCKMKHTDQLKMRVRCIYEAVPSVDNYLLHSRETE